MLKLTFKQTQAEIMVRAASTVLFNALSRSGYPLVSLSQLSEEPQYGFTASAEPENIGPKLVRITDLQDGGINWNTVPYCKCDKPEQYLLEANDILFARTGATTGKTHLVKQAENAVFASYLIRLRPKSNVLPEYLYFFFQSDAYWSQISEEKEGSAQPNVNGKKLINIQIPLVDDNIQSEISKFLAVVRERQDGSTKQLPNLPPPLEDQRRVVLRIEELAAKVGEARGLRSDATKEAEVLAKSAMRQLFKSDIGYQEVTIESVCTAIIDNLHSNPTYSDDGVPCVRSSDVGWGSLLLNTARRTSEDEYQRRTVRGEPTTDDVVLVREGGGTGKVAIVEEGQRFSLGQRVMMLRPDKEQVLPKFFLYQILSPFTQEEQILPKCKGSASPHLNIGALKKFAFLLPPISEQRQIVSYLDGLQIKVDALKQLQSETEAELNALLPSILDKAFKGEL